MKLELRYCAMWNYEPQAVSLTAKLLPQYKQQIEEMKLTPSSGGCFELKADGELVYSKLETGKFPDEAAIVDLIGSRLKKKKK